MTTFQNTFLSEIVSGGEVPLSGRPIPIGQRAYFQERLKGRVYSLIMNEFLKQKEKFGVTQAAIGRRLDKRPEQVNRWLSGPSNWTLETVSDLLLAICAGEPSLVLCSLQEESHPVSCQEVQTLEKAETAARRSVIPQDLLAGYQACPTPDVRRAIESGSLPVQSRSSSDTFLPSFLESQSQAQQGLRSR
jgi:hypothetical protein